MKIVHEQQEAQGRFALYENEQFAGEITYTKLGKNKISIDHTIVEKAFGGKGFGKVLVLEIAAYARANNIKVVPICTYAKAVFEKDTTLHDLMA